MNDYKQQILYYKLEDIFLDLFCYCYDKNINLEDIIYEINFDFDVFKLKHHKYIIKKIFKEELENNEELEKIFISYVKFYNKYKNHYKNNPMHIKKLLDYLELIEKIK